MKNFPIVLEGDCCSLIPSIKEKFVPDGVHLTFLDPPFNQEKEYSLHKDNLPEDDYWNWMQKICKLLYEVSAPGAALYFMQREKNAEFVLKCLRETGWTLQNLIIWKKLTSAVPQRVRYGKQFQILAFGVKGARPRVFHRLRIDPPLPPNYSYERTNGIFVTDIWDDVRELTSGYFAGDEAIRMPDGKRFHKQQSPISLLLRILLSSTKINDTVLDPFAGTGTTGIVAYQLQRNSICIELDPKNVNMIKSRIQNIREADNITRYIEYYRFTEDLGLIFPNSKNMGFSSVSKRNKQGRKDLTDFLKIK